MTSRKERHRVTSPKSENQGQSEGPPRRARPTPAGLTAMIAIAIALLALMWPNDIKHNPGDSLASEEREGVRRAL